MPGSIAALFVPIFALGVARFLFVVLEIIGARPVTRERNARGSSHV